MDALQAATPAGSGDSREYPVVSSPLDLLEIPWKRHGMDPATGLGCWGAVWHAARCYGYEFPRFEEAIESTTDELADGVGRFSGLFEEVKDPRPGDVLLFRFEKMHIGIMVTGTKFLHSYEGGGVCRSRLNGMYRNRLVSILRWKQPST